MGLSYDHSEKPIGDFKLIVGNPPPKLTDQENLSIVNSFWSSSQYQSIENNTKRNLTRISKR